MPEASLQNPTETPFPGVLPPHPLVLMILDGFGHRENPAHNAIAAANPQYWRSLLAKYAHTTIEPGGIAVGLPEGQFGNSEVGHLNLGAGRVVYQDITKIDHEIETGSFFTNPALVESIRATPAHRKIHLMGLLGDGGVHSSDRHYMALLDLLVHEGVDGKRICFHAITDGRDTRPDSALGHMETLQRKIALIGGRIATVSGRYWAMDRDTNWDRVGKYWDCVTLGRGEVATDALEAVRLSHAEGVTDEFIKPTMVVSHGSGLGRIESGDLVIWFNFRADRARQFCRALTEGDAFDSACFRRAARPSAKLVTMTGYLKGLDARVAYPQGRPTNTLGEFLAGQGIRQFRCAETEKYAHVTYFFSGGVEQAFPGEDRVLVPSPKVSTYNLQPEMSLPEVADALCSAIATKQYGLVLTNFANGDMVGHTGIMEAAVKAVGAIDAALRRVVEAALANGYSVLVTADHGNCEEMAADDGSTLTNHSYNPVPLVWIPSGANHPLASATLDSGGRLADVAPTALAAMGLSPPPDMTGRCLLKH
jgi:2,3-bisphosphoglycerate-independent phosphoglycerate mutase